MPASTPDAGTSPTMPAPPIDPRRGRTAQRLLDAAERLFAQRGVTQVSMREIVRESGQRNPSAARYHFGSREALIVAVVARRMEAVNARRHAQLDTLVRERPAPDLRQVMHALVAPMADVVQSTDWGPRYVQIVAELAQWPNDLALDRLSPAQRSSMDRIESLATSARPDLPRPLMRARLQMMRGYTAYTLSSWLRLHGPVTPANRRRFRADARRLSDFLADGLGGPPTT